MPRRRSKKANNPLNEVNKTSDSPTVDKVYNSDRLKSVGSTSGSLDGNPSTSAISDLGTNTAALYDELDSFRQRWRREMSETKPKPGREPLAKASNEEDSANRIHSIETSSSHGSKGSNGYLDSQTTNDSSEQIYAKAKKLFMIAVGHEQDDMHHESIRYYKLAMRLCPDIEKRIFMEQSEASARASIKIADKYDTDNEILSKLNDKDHKADKVQLYELIYRSYSIDNATDRYNFCLPKFKPKPGVLHISDLPQELMLLIFRYVIGEDLDLASLEALGLVCRGFYLLTQSSTLWRAICHTVWGHETLYHQTLWRDETVDQVNWRQMFLERSRVNFDGVYISRTRYIRQGDVGFQDITYRPFHVISYYRYLRFFPNRKVLILTTNEEPDKIIPIFRHASSSKQFSAELSILEGTYEFSDRTNKLRIVAWKNRKILSNSTPSSRRQAQYQWSKLAPLSQKFDLRFKLQTIESSPHRNNALKWLNYTIVTKLEAGHEIRNFELSQDTFPNLIFARVEKFNLRLTRPLSDQ